MEQRPETPSPVVLGAGTDPTHIPGLDTPEAEEPETAAPDSASSDSAAPSDSTASSSAATAQAAEPALGTPDDEEAAASTAEDGEQQAEEAPPEGPAFRVFDHRSSIAADGDGVVFRLDDTEARFDWSEIGSVEIGSSRFGRRFEVAVGTTDHRRFDAEVIASSKQKLEEWTAELDAVLDAWFDDGTK